MTDKKEIFDYLRNQQKSFEIESKINGVNLWVLVGAIGITIWQIIGTLNEKIWSQPRIVLHSLLFTEALYVFFSWNLSKERFQHEARYSPSNLKEHESPFLIFVGGILLLTPPAASLTLSEKSASAIILGLLGAITISVSIAAVWLKVFAKEPNSEKFPKPSFGHTMQVRTISVLIGGCIFSIPIFQEGFFTWIDIQNADETLIKNLALFSTLYLLVLLVIDRKQRDNNITWTYRLETELFTGSISAEVALRRIEHRELGPRLQDVMNNFFDDMDTKFSALDDMVEQCNSKLESVKDIPVQYNIERESRFREILQPVADQTKILTLECKEFGAYLTKLNEKNIGPNRAILSPHLSSLIARYKGYLGKLKNINEEFEDILKSLVQDQKIEQ